VSGTKVTPAAGGSSRRDAAGSAGPSGRGGWPSPVGLVITGFTVIGLGLRLFLLSRPGYLLGVTQYDDGPYFGSALRLVVIDRLPFTSPDDPLMRARLALMPPQVAECSKQFPDFPKGELPSVKTPYTEQQQYRITFIEL